MTEIYELIQQNPAYFAWAFGLINAFWLLFTYFYKQSHDKAMAQLASTLRLEAERRIKVFSLKAAQYETYVVHLDSFGRKRHAEIQKRMRPIFDEYFQSYLGPVNTN